MIKAIIVDDERKAQLLLSQLLEKHCNNVDVLSLASSVDEAIDAIHKHKPDIVFLDVEMPGGDGFELLERLHPIDFQVIFTTAYKHYAIQAIKFSALDYLLKPIDIDELIESVHKLTAKVQSKEPVQETPEKVCGSFRFRLQRQG